MALFNDHLYFVAADDTHGREIWRINAQGSLELAADIFPGAESSDPSGLTVYDGALYFAASDGGRGQELWRVDAQGTLTPLEIFAGPAASEPRSFAEFQGELYFSADDGVHGREIHKVQSDGSIVRVSDVAPGPAWFPTDGLIAFGGHLYMIGQTAAEGAELWRMDEDQSFALAADINPGPASSLKINLHPGKWPAPFATVFNDELYFTADDGVHGRELWRVNAEVDAALLADIYSGPGDASPAGLHEFGGALYFSATAEPFHIGREVYRLVPDDLSHRNTTLPADVDGNGSARVTDLVQLVNFLRTNGPTDLRLAAFGAPYWDVSGDDRVTIADLVELVIRLREQLTAAQGEGEPGALDATLEAAMDEIAADIGCAALAG